MKYNFYATTTTFDEYNEGKIYKVSADLKSVEEAYIFGAYICECLDLGDTADTISTSNLDWNQYFRDSRESMIGSKYDSEEEVIDYLNNIDTYIDYQILYIAEDTRNHEVIYTKRDWNRF